MLFTMMIYRDDIRQYGSTIGSGKLRLQRQGDKSRGDTLEGMDENQQTLMVGEWTGLYIDLNVTQRPMC